MSTTPAERLATLSIDGSVDHLNHEAGAAAILKLTDNDEVHYAKRTCKTHRSSDAEFTALSIGINLALEQRVTHLVVYSDAEAVANAINGRARFPSAFAHLKQLLRRFVEAYGVAIARDDNGHADLLARVARRNPNTPRGTRKRRQGDRKHAFHGSGQRRRAQQRFA